MKDLGPLLPLLLIAAVFYLLLIRPQRRRQLQLMAAQRGLEVGDEVMLAAGIVGTVVALDEDSELIEVEVAPGVPLRVARAAIARVLTPARGEDGDEAHDGDHGLGDDPSATGGPVDLGKPGPTVP